MFVLDPQSLVVWGFFSLGPQEMIVVGILGVLLFGKRLPEVGRSLGKGIVEFKKGLRGIEDEFDAGISAHSTPSSTTTRYSEPARSYDAPEVSVPKFEPPAAAPTFETGSVPHQD